MQGLAHKGGAQVRSPDSSIVISDGEATSDSESEGSQCPLLTLGSKCAKKRGNLRAHERRRMIRRAALKSDVTSTKVDLSVQARAIDNSCQASTKLVKKDNGVRT